MPEIDFNGRPQSHEDLPGWYAAALAAQASSGLSVAEYADGIGVTATTLYQWRRRLAAGGGDKGHRSRRSRVGLVEVTVERGAVTANDAKTFVVRLGRDRGIEVPRGFADADLRRLVTLLESC